MGIPKSKLTPIIAAVGILLSGASFEAGKLVGGREGRSAYRPLIQKYNHSLTGCIDTIHKYKGVAHSTLEDLKICKEIAYSASKALETCEDTTGGHAEALQDCSDMLDKVGRERDLCKRVFKIYMKKELP